MIALVKQGPRAHVPAPERVTTRERMREGDACARVSVSSCEIGRGWVLVSVLTSSLAVGLFTNSLLCSLAHYCVH